MAFYTIRASVMGTLLCISDKVSMRALSRDLFSEIYVVAQTAIKNPQKQVFNDLNDWKTIIKALDLVWNCICQP